MTVRFALSVKLHDLQLNLVFVDLAQGVHTSFDRKPEIL